eukprot:758317-Hanusia_phi.AAC.10
MKSLSHLGFILCFILFQSYEVAHGFLQPYHTGFPASSKSLCPLFPTQEKLSFSTARSLVLPKCAPQFSLSLALTRSARHFNPSNISEFRTNYQSPQSQISKSRGKASNGQRPKKKVDYRLPPEDESSSSLASERVSEKRMTSPSQLARRRYSWKCQKTGRHQDIMQADVVGPNSTWASVPTQRRRNDIKSAMDELLACEKSSDKMRKILSSWDFDEQLLSRLIVELGRKQKKVMVADMLRWMREEGERRKISLSTLPFNACIRALERMGDWREALAILNIMDKDSVQPDIVTYNTILSALRHSPDIQNVFMMLKRMKEKLTPDIVSFNTALAACQRRCDWESGVAILEMMREEGIDRDVFTYSTLISLCDRCRKYDDAFVLKEEMDATGVSPNIYTFNALIAVCKNSLSTSQMSRKRQNTLTIAQILFAEAKAAGLRPDIVTYNSLLGVYMEMGKWKESYDLLFEIDDQNVTTDVITYSTLISTFAKTRKYDLAIEMHNKMVEKNVMPNVITYNSLIFACLRANNFSQAFTFFHDMQDKGISPNVVTYSTMIASCRSRENWVVAFDLFLEMIRKEIPPDPMTFSSLLSVCQHSKQVPYSSPHLGQP